MKNFSELTHDELINLTQEQIEAYSDIAIAEAGLKKTAYVKLDLPEYLKNIGKFCPPERDVTTYQVEDWSFTEMEKAQEFSKLIASFIPYTVSTNYDWDTGSEYRYISGSGKERTISINTIQTYSREKYEGIKAQLKNLKKLKEDETNKEDEQIESVIDYEAVENIERTIKYKVVDALNTEAKVESIVNNYDKYFSITNDKNKTIETLFTVFSIADDFTRDLINKKLESK